MSVGVVSIGLGGFIGGCGGGGAADDIEDGQEIEDAGEGAVEGAEFVDAAE